MQSVKSTSLKDILLVGDVGGTNCRLANCDAASGQITDIDVFSVSELSSLDEALHRFMEKNPTNRYTNAAISIANPISGDKVAMTNAHWNFSIEQTRKSRRLDQLVMLNDWESVALSLPALDNSDVEQINMCIGHDSGNRALCGVGTGLGAAGLIKARDSGWVPVSGEGGHISFSPVNQEEIQILEMIRESYEHVSFEKILSGSGLISLHQTIAKIAGVIVEKASPQQIVSKASSQSDPICAQTVKIFCGILGNFAGNLCLTLGATGGIYVGGGVVQKIDDAGLFNREIFLDRLKHKGRLSEWLNDIPTYLIKTPYAGLVGAAAALGVKYPRVAHTEPV
jgi:glucokinase